MIQGGVIYTLNIEPKAQPRPRFSKWGAYKDAKQKDYEKRFRKVLAETYKEAPVDGSLSITLVFNIERPKSVKRALPCVRPDLDNYVKQFLDLSNGVLFKDDCQICEIITRKQYDCAGSIDFMLRSI
jgi:Holliday junction resolvase RusA-like endonuclease